MTPTRETVMAALLAMFPVGPTLKTVSRRVRLWDQVPQEERPALFIGEHLETYHRQPLLPKVIELGVDLFIYTWAAETDSSPATKLNDVLDYVDGVLQSGILSERQTLGGTVWRCWVDGQIFKDPGDLDGQGVAIVPIRILVPQGR